MSAQLSVAYSFARNELRIGFDCEEHAIAYQMLNREARIYSTSPRKVWLPLPKGLDSLSASDYGGLLLLFSTREFASKWRDQAILAEPHPHDLSGTEYFIQRDWSSRSDLERKLRSPHIPLRGKRASHPPNVFEAVVRHSNPYSLEPQRNL